MNAQQEAIVLYDDRILIDQRRNKVGIPEVENKAFEKEITDKGFRPLCKNAWIKNNGRIS